MEVKNGEGKTLAATMPLYLHALTGHDVHLITANEYLAKRDAQWMGPVFTTLGLSVGLIQPGGRAYLYEEPSRRPDSQDRQDPITPLREVDRRDAYGADVLYAPIDEIIFDYLRDNRLYDWSSYVQSEHFYAIVDEADIIMLDLARAPFSISTPEAPPSNLYTRFAQLVRIIPPEEITMGGTGVTLSDKAIDMLQARLGVDNLYTPENQELVYHLDLALKAKFLYHRDDDYIVKDKAIVIIDKLRRRPLPGRHFGEGLHQALEAKEDLTPQADSILTGIITVQNYLRLYEHLAGMTGTAATDREEFQTVYDLDVISIPVHKPIIRKDYQDVVYKSRYAKVQAAMREIKEMHECGRPVLVGTRSDADADLLSDMLVRQGIEHQVLTGKYHEREAQIISQAGQAGQVTISTRMAGRGVDIVLGPGVKELGGLHVIGTERHESRRLDEQLRGRAGRCGDPGSSRFYLALDDDLMRRFGGKGVAKVMERLGVEEDVPIESSFVSKSIEGAQQRVQGYDLDIRRELLRYDDVLDQQRREIYAWRQTILTQRELRKMILEIMYETIHEALSSESLQEMEGEEFARWWNELLAQFSLTNELDTARIAQEPWENLERYLKEQVTVAYAKKSQDLGKIMIQLERAVLLRVIDNHWTKYLQELDALRQGIGLRSVGGQNPLAMYSHEASRMFESLLDNVRRDVAFTILRAQVVRMPEPKKPRRLSSDVMAQLAERYSMLWPARGELIKTFAQHGAIDILVDPGTTVVAADTGQIQSLTSDRDGELFIKIDHGEGVVTIYGRLAVSLVEREQTISAGRPIGTCKGVLHFGVSYRGVPVDPLIFLDK